MGFKLHDFCRRNRPAAAHYHRNMCCALLRQHVHHVFEILDVTALVGAAGDGVGIFLQGGVHDFGDAAIVAKVDHLGAVRLQKAANDVDGGIVPIKQ